MEGPRFPVPPRSPSPHLSRRAALRVLGGGIAAMVLGARAMPTLASSAPTTLNEAPAALGNPAGRVLLPGEAGLTGYGLDLSLVGPPAVFFPAGDPPGWSSELSAAVGGFAFGYAATLATPHWNKGKPERAVQVCVHHGFPSTGDADVAWFSLTKALAGGGGVRATQAHIRTIDVVEVFEVSGRRSILATVSTDRFHAVVVASRTGATLATVAIADFVGKRPRVDEAGHLAEAEVTKLQQPYHGESGLAAAFFRRWTPGFALDSAARAPFFSWPTVLHGEPVPVAGETSATLSQHRQFSGAVKYQSHIEGPMLEARSTFADHTLYYAGQSSYFEGSRQAQAYQEETASRLRAGLPGLVLTNEATSRAERHYTYQMPSSFGLLSGLMLSRLVTDGDAPLTLSLHLLAVPNTPAAATPAAEQVWERLRSVVGAMRDGLYESIAAPQRAPLTIVVPSPT